MTEEYIQPQGLQNCRSVGEKNTQNHSRNSVSSDIKVITLRYLIFDLELCIFIMYKLPCLTSPAFAIINNDNAYESQIYISFVLLTK